MTTGKGRKTKSGKKRQLEKLAEIQSANKLFVCRGYVQRRGVDLLITETFTFLRLLIQRDKVNQQIY